MTSAHPRQAAAYERDLRFSVQPVPRNIAQARRRLDACRYTRSRNDRASDFSKTNTCSVARFPVSQSWRSATQHSESGAPTNGSAEGAPGVDALAATGGATGCANFKAPVAIRSNRLMLRVNPQLQCFLASGIQRQQIRITIGAPMQHAALGTPWCQLPRASAAIFRLHVIQRLSLLR